MAVVHLREVGGGVRAGGKGREATNCGRERIFCYLLEKAE